MTQNNERRFKGRTHEFIQDGTKLGGGMTAEVYPVRIYGDKNPELYALKLLTGQEHHDAFFREVETLQFFSRSHKDRLANPDGTPMTPAVIDFQDEGPDQFIVMTLARGKRLDELTRDEGRLSEAEAISIMTSLSKIFHILHSQVGRSYLDFQPRNVYWQREIGSMLVLDFGLLSPSGQSPDVAHDVLTLGQLFYRMVVGIYPPKRGLAADPNWDKLTVGTQEILRRANHINPRLRYANAEEVELDCAVQKTLWTKDASTLLEELGNENDVLASLQHDSPGMVKQILKTRNLVQILQARRGEVGRVIGVFDQIAGEVEAIWQKYGDRLKTGIRSLESKDSSGAREIFNQAFAEAGDDTQRLTAQRWLQVTNIRHEGNRTLAIDACKALEKGEPQAALALFSSMTPPVEEAAGTLQADAQAQAAWKTAQPLLKKAQETSSPAAVTSALAALRTLQAAADKLPASYRALVGHDWGQLDSWITDLDAKAKTVQTKEQDIQTLAQEVRGKHAAGVLSNLQTKLDEAPRNPALVGLVLEVVQNDLIKVSGDLAVGDLALRMGPVRKLISLGLTHGKGGEHEAGLMAAWRSTEALVNLDQALAGTTFVGQELDKCLADLAQGDDVSRDTLKQAALNHVMAEAGRRQDIALADHVVLAAQDARVGGMDRLYSEQATIRADVEELEQKRKTQSASLLTDLEKRVRGQLGSQRPEGVEAARAQLIVGDRLFGRDEKWVGLRTQLDHDIEAEQARLARMGQYEQDRQLIVEKLADLQTHLDQIQNQADADQLVQEVRGLYRAARDVNVTDLFTEIESLGHQAQDRAKYIETIQAPLAEAQAAYDVYLSLDPSDPQLRSARLAKLNVARTKLAMVKKPETTIPALANLSEKVDTAWSNEGFEQDPQNPANPLREDIKALAERIERMGAVATSPVTNGINQGFSVPDDPNQKKPDSAWQVALLTALLAVLLVLAGVWFLVDQYSANTAPSQENSGAATQVSQPSGPTSTPSPTGTPIPPEAAMLIAEQTLAPRLTEIAQANEQALAQKQTALDAAVSGNDESVKNVIATATAGAAQLAEIQTAIAITTANQLSIAEIQTTREFTQTNREETLNTQANTQATAQAVLTSQAEAQATAQSQLNATATAVAARQATVTVQETAVAQQSANTALAAPGQFEITFPADGVNLYVAPWQIQVTSSVWLRDVKDYRLTLSHEKSLSKAVLATFSLAVDEAVYTYTRSFTGTTALFDSFPDLTDEGKGFLGIIENDQLPSGEYVIGLDAQVNGQWQPLPTRSGFTILDRTATPPITATIGNASVDLQRRLAPNMDGIFDSINKLNRSLEVRLLGRSFSFYDDPLQQGDEKQEFWYLVETVQAPLRRGWVPSRFIVGLTEAQMATVAELAPSQN